MRQGPSLMCLRQAHHNVRRFLRRLVVQPACGTARFRASCECKTIEIGAGVQQKSLIRGNAKSRKRYRALDEWTIYAAKEARNHRITFLVLVSRCSIFKYLVLMSLSSMWRSISLARSTFVNDAPSVPWYPLIEVFHQQRRVSLPEVRYHGFVPELRLAD